MNRSQAALFDGIMFLLFASFSIAMLYVFLNEYGKAQDEALRSGFILAYVQDVGKAIFFINVKSLKDAGNVADARVRQEICKWDPDSGIAFSSTCYFARPGFPYSDLQDIAGTREAEGCAALGSFEQATVADLLKRDLGDGDAEEDACLDDRFGNPFGSGTLPNGFCERHDDVRWLQVPRLPGKLALRCALKELMKPLETAGYKYFADLQGERTSGAGGRDVTIVPIKQECFGPACPSDATRGTGFRVTNHWKATEQNWQSCEQAVSRDPLELASGAKTDNILSVKIPFRVTKGTTLEEILALTLRICIWPSSSRR